MIPFILLRSSIETIACSLYGNLRFETLWFSFYKLSRINPPDGELIFKVSSIFESSMCRFHSVRSASFNRPYIYIYNLFVDSLISLANRKKESRPTTKRISDPVRKLSRWPAMSRSFVALLKNTRNDIPIRAYPHSRVASLTNNALDRESLENCVAEHRYPGFLTIQKMLYILFLSLSLYLSRAIHDHIATTFRLDFDETTCVSTGVRDFSVCRTNIRDDV